jgi:hypothetical protein
MDTAIINNVKLEKCSICKRDDAYTSTHVEVESGVKIYVCNECLEQAKTNFIWICMSCGTVHMRNKKMVINNLKDQGLKRAYILCEDMQIIQGIDMCISCDPAGVLEYVRGGSIC